MTALLEHDDRASSKSKASGVDSVPVAPQRTGPKRELSARQVQMIALGGTIGTGLFLGSGEALSGAGPLGALIAYGLVGTVAYASLCAIGEMTSHAPISGTFPHFGARWVDPAFGFALGYARAGLISQLSG